MGTFGILIKSPAIHLLAWKNGKWILRNLKIDSDPGSLTSRYSGYCLVIRQTTQILGSPSGQASEWKTCNSHPWITILGVEARCSHPELAYIGRAEERVTGIHSGFTLGLQIIQI
jgi:hypothetical protein